MGLTMKTLVFCAFTKKSDVQGGWDSQKTGIEGGIALKRGSLDSLQI